MTMAPQPLSRPPEGSRPRMPLNLVAYDGLGRLFVWDLEAKQLHFVEIEGPDSLQAFGTDPGALLARHKLKTVQLSASVDFEVLHLAFNRAGRSLVLAGNGALMVVNLLAPSSTSSGICRVQKVGAERIFSRGDGHWLRILQIGWHPYSDTHLGVLSSDGCFRLFDLSLDAENAEQEYYLQSRSLERIGGSTLVRAIAFAFGGEHLWDRFTVFMLYNDGSVFALCPIVPFGSMYNGIAIEELAKDATQMELLVDRPNALTQNASLALAWLDAVFPELDAFANSPSGDSLGTSFVQKAHAYVPLDASLVLQGPFPMLCRQVIGDEKVGYLDETDDPATGQAVGLVYNVVGKDSVLAISTKEGHVKVYVLADEVQPIWDMGKPPQLTVDDKGHVLAVGMLVEASTTGFTSTMPHTRENEDSSNIVWSGRIPPLLQLAVVDLALLPTVLNAGPVLLFADPVVPERLYCHHPGGLDAILLQWLPFSAQNDGKASAEFPPPAVFPVLDICPTGSTTPQPLMGVAFILDSLGESWVVAVTANWECAVVNMKPQRTLPEPLILDGEKKQGQDSGTVEVGVFQMMSKELLLGPKDIPLTKLTSSGAPLTVDTIEGRTFLHDQCKLLHEKYIEYAHRVHVELTSHGTRLHDLVEEQHRLVKQAERKLRQSEKESSVLVKRIQLAVIKNQDLEQRVKLCSALPGVSEKSLTLSELEFKAQLDTMRLQDLDILSSAAEVLSVRSERFLGTRSVSSGLSSPSARRNNKVTIPDSQMRRLKQAVETLSYIVEESSMKVNLIDESVSHRELLKDR